MWRTLQRRGTLAVLGVWEALLAAVGRRKPYGVLCLDLDGDLAEDGGERRLLGLLRRTTRDYLGLITLLRSARDDERVLAVLVRCDGLHASWARVQGLRRALVRLRQAGKRVWVHCQHAGLLEYYLASAAEHVSLAPAATVDVTGLSSEAIFFVDALQKLGIEADVVQMGRYKAAGERFTRRDMSPAHREMMESLIDDLYGQLVDAVAEGRGLEPGAVRDILDRGPFVGGEALTERLIDQIAYADQVEARLAESCGGAAVIEGAAYAKRRGREMQRQALRRTRATVAVLHVGGTIKSGESIPGPEGANAAGSASIAAALKQIRERDDIGAVVVRIASPGGSVLGSDLIWREVVRTREKKPVVASCGDVAASGGYYVALAGTPLLAEAGTITGSIGVIAGKASLRGFYDRLGISKELVSRGRHAALYSDYAPLGDEGRARIRAEADAFYRDFVGKVAEARRLSPDAVAAVAEGRVWTGRQAWTRGLVDELGGLEEAFDAAKKAIGIPADEPVLLERFPRQRRLWKLSLDLNLPNQHALTDLLGVLPSLRFLLRERVWAVLPFQIRFF